MITSSAPSAPYPSIAPHNCNVSLLNYLWLFFPPFPKVKQKHTVVGGNRKPLINCDSKQL